MRFLFVPLLPRPLLAAWALTIALLGACSPSAHRASPPESIGQLGDGAVDSTPTFSFVVEPRPNSVAITPFLASTDTPLVAIAAPASKCNEQRAQSFLMRSTYIHQLGLTTEMAQQRKRLHHAAIAYRTRHYGYVEGFGDSTMNPRPPYDYSGDGKFFGLHVRMNSRVLVALGCVEETIEQTCSNTPYVPQVLDGLRARNTFHNNEVSNHLYGIAIDIDPVRNACCHCVAPSRDAPICKKPAKTPFDHAEIPPCWVEAFEKYGFYWLGHDVLEDTMHFEFLGDPNQIKRSTSAPAEP